MADEEVWKRRFHLFMALRLLGVLLFIAGLAIAMSNLVRPGGSPTLGGLMAIAGALTAAFVGKVLKRHWERQDR